MKRKIIFFLILLTLFSLPLYAQSLANPQAAAALLRKQAKPPQFKRQGAEYLLHRHNVRRNNFEFIGLSH
jgi:hypothetical protein